jgi:hypothetical protein
MSNAQADSLIGGIMARTFHLRVRRRSAPPTAWIWEICVDSSAEVYRRSDAGFRSAEEAWAAGQLAISGFGRAR